MNEDTLSGHGNTIGGKVKETVGAATSDRSMQADGMLDQVKGAIQKTIGSVTDNSTTTGVGAGTGAGGTGTGVATGQPAIVGKARQFAKDRPWAAAALAGVVGMAVLNTLRGKR